MTAAPEVTAGPAPALAWLQVLGALLLLVVGAALDPLGRLLVLPVAGLLLALGARDLILRPVLRASADGLCVVRGLRRISVAWPAVVRMRVVADRRTSLLEIDLDDTVLVLSRRQLGAPPAEVLGQLEELVAQPGP